MAEEAVEYEVDNTTDNWGTIDTSPKPEEENKVEYEIEEDATPVQSQEAQPSDVKEEKENPSELEGIETKGAQKRIRQLIKQRKDREDKIQELENRIAQYEETIRSKDQELVSSLKTNIESNELQLQEQVKLAESAYRRALEGGEPDEIVAAQRLLTKSEVELGKIADAKVQYDKQEQQEQQPVVQQQQQVSQVAVPNPADYDPKAVEWATNNPWFGQDQVMTAAALAIDAQLKEEGFDPSDDEFYGEVDSRLRSSFPAKFSEATSQEQQSEPKASVPKPSQVVSGASRTVTSPTTNRSNKVKLSKQDIDMANRWGIPLERYAEQKLVAEQADGEYTTILTNKRGG
tara:strand:+ start:92 stop:1129 length:1038 start_codon:yes stop_codon:yes gene_type:complete